MTVSKQKIPHNFAFLSVYVVSTGVCIGLLAIACWLLIPGIRAHERYIHLGIIAGSLLSGSFIVNRRGIGRKG